MKRHSELQMDSSNTVNRALQGGFCPQLEIRCIGRFASANPVLSKPVFTLEFHTNPRSLAPVPFART